ncbi:hypothetical protein [Streptomyces sp. NPDC093598]|uniref:hypothetical protein n=1 Tax=Streptomyces sp. NPDC093598 TaxID=3366046 RepID=UPI00382AEBEF
MAVSEATEAAYEDAESDRTRVGASHEGGLVQSPTDSTVLAYKGLDGIPLWLLFGIAILAFVIFGAAQIRKRK